jgi:hypothetical protein
MNHIMDIVLVLAIVLILASVIPWAVIKLIAYALVAIWVLGLVVFGLGWAYYYYRHRGDVAK